MEKIRRETDDLMRKVRKETDDPIGRAKGARGPSPDSVPLWEVGPSEDRMGTFWADLALALEATIPLPSGAIIRSNWVEAAAGTLEMRSCGGEILASLRGPLRGEATLIYETGSFLRGLSGSWLPCLLCRAPRRGDRRLSSFPRCKYDALLRDDAMVHSESQRTENEETEHRCRRLGWRRLGWSINCCLRCTERGGVPFLEVLSGSLSESIEAGCFGSDYCVPRNDEWRLKVETFLNPLVEEDRDLHGPRSSPIKAAEWKTKTRGGRDQAIEKTDLEIYWANRTKDSRSDDRTRVLDPARRNSTNSANPILSKRRNRRKFSDHGGVANRCTGRR